MGQTLLTSASRRGEQETGGIKLTSPEPEGMFSMGQSLSPGSGCQGTGEGGRGGKDREGRPGLARAAGEDGTRTWASGTLPIPPPRGRLPAASRVPTRGRPAHAEPRPTRRGLQGPRGFQSEPICRPCPGLRSEPAAAAGPQRELPGEQPEALPEKRGPRAQGAQPLGSPLCDLPGQSLCSDSGLLLKPNIANQAKQTVYLQNVSVLH